MNFTWDKEKWVELKRVSKKRKVPKTCFNCEFSSFRFMDVGKLAVEKVFCKAPIIDKDGIRARGMIFNADEPSECPYDKVVYAEWEVEE